MPWLLIISVVSAVGYYYTTSKAVPLDAKLSIEQTAAVRYALTYVTDPVEVEDFSKQCGLNALPLSAAALHKRAVALGAKS